MHFAILKTHLDKLYKLILCFRFYLSNFHMRTHQTKIAWEWKWGERKKGEIRNDSIKWKGVPSDEL